GLVGRVIALLRKEVQEVLLFQLEEVGSELALLARLFGDSQRVGAIAGLFEFPGFRLLLFSLLRPGAEQARVEDEVLVGVERVERWHAGGKAESESCQCD